MDTMRLIRSQFRKSLCSFCGLMIVLSQPCFSQTNKYQILASDVIEARLREVPAKKEDRKTTLKNIFAEAGCAEQFTEQPVNQRNENLVCVLPGETDSTIIVGAHYDMADRGRGVVDNWTGAALLPSLYQNLQNEPRRHTYLFVSFCCEEQGLVGSGFYVKQLTEEQRSKTVAMVNLDCLGLSSTKMEASRSDKRLVNLLAIVADNLTLQLSGVNASRIGMDDTESFKKVKIPSISIHSITQETLRTLHSARDNLDSVRLSDYYDTYRLMAAFLASLDVLLK